MMKNLLLASLLTIASFTSNAGIIFFGEDLNPGVSTSNSDAAQASFLAALTGVGTEDFESFASGTGGPLAIDFGIAGTATLSGTGQILGSSGFGRFATSGSNYWNTSENFTIEFSQAVSAFGFYGTDIGDFAGQVTMEFLSGATTSYTVANSLSAPDGSLLYWGIIDVANPFTKITFGNTDNSDVFGFDDMTIGLASQVQDSTSVSEPTSIAILSLAMLGLASFRRRK